MAVSGARGLYMCGGFRILSGILRTAPLSSTSSYEIITVPMFILMAEFVIISGIANDLFRAAAMNRSLAIRSEEHTSELQSRGHLVCRLLLEKKNKKQT